MAPHEIKVDLKRKLHRAERRILGINTNYVTDHKARRAAGQGFEAALRQMGVKSLRFPGGEKSDSHFWAEPPDFLKPKPSLARVGGFLGKEFPSPNTDHVKNFREWVNEPMDFDQFMELCRNLGAEATICVCFDCMYKPAPAGGWSADKDLLLKAAASWVRYSKSKGYGVKYWELGNESYLNTYNGGTRPRQYAKDFIDFARAMKAEDPSILIGANGAHRKDAAGQLGRAHGDIWWREVLEAAAEHIDFLVVHPYPCWEWGSYDWYRLKPYDFTEAARGAKEALEEWAPAHAGRIRVAATELNSADWSSGGWAFLNDLGHAVVLFDILGEHLLLPYVDMAQVWNTRWLSPEPPSLWDALGPQNELRPTGIALELWNQHLKDTLVQVDAALPLKAYASLGDDGSVSLFIINREMEKQGAALKGLPDKAALTWTFTGTGPYDQKPVVTQGSAAPSGGSLEMELPPVSVTVLEFKP